MKRSRHERSQRSRSLSGLELRRPPISPSPSKGEGWGEGDAAVLVAKSVAHAAPFALLHFSIGCCNRYRSCCDPRSPGGHAG